MTPRDTRWAHWGRNTFEDGVLYLGWSGSMLETETNSPCVTLELVTDRLVREEAHLGRAGIYVDGREERTLLLRGPAAVSVPLSPGTGHTLRLVKLSEAAFGAVGVRSVSFRAPEGEALFARAPAAPGRRIEFIGDSITCGYGVGGRDENDPFRTGGEDPMKGYAGLTADALGARAQWVSWSGIGVLSDYVPPERNEPGEEILMGQLYPFWDWRLDGRRGRAPRPYDGSFRPDLAVIHLGTNDDSFVRGDPEREAAFGVNYRALLDTVHRLNPEAAILCCLGIMGTGLCREAERQVRRFRGEVPGCRICWHSFREQDGAADGYGSDFHPSERTHRKAARELEEVIRGFMDWRD